MVDIWKVVIDKATGELVSTGTVVADDLDPKFEVQEIGADRPDFAKVEWDKGTRSFKERVTPEPSESAEMAAARGLVAQAKATLKNQQASAADRMRAASFLHEMGELE